MQISHNLRRVTQPAILAGFGLVLDNKWAGCYLPTYLLTPLVGELNTLIVVIVYLSIPH